MGSVAAAAIPSRDHFLDDLSLALERVVLEGLSGSGGGGLDERELRVDLRPPPRRPVSPLTSS